MKKSLDRLTALEKVAVLLIALGQDTTAEIMKHLTEAESERIVQAIAGMHRVDTDTMDQVLEEFEQLFRQGKFASQGGTEFARSALELAMGPDRAQRVMDRIGRARPGLDVLKDADPGQILPILRKEHPQAIALILTQLPADLAARVLSGLAEDVQADVIYRIATLNTVAPETLRELEESLSEELQAVLTGRSTRFDGPKTVAAILNRAQPNTEGHVLESIAQNNPDLAESIRSEMFVFDDIAQLSDRDMQILIKQIDSHDLALALKNAGQNVKDRFFGNLSQNRAGILKEEIEFLGKVRLSDVQSAQHKVAQTVRELQENGQLRIVRPDADDVII